MKSSELFEIFNHFIQTKDGTQIIGLGDQMEVFSSKTLDTGKLTHGETAPEQFRKAIKRYEKSKKKINVNLISLIEIDSGGLMVLDVTAGRASSKSTISFATRDDNLIAFVE